MLPTLPPTSLPTLQPNATALALANTNVLPQPGPLLPGAQLGFNIRTLLGATFPPTAHPTLFNAAVTMNATEILYLLISGLPYLHF